MHCTMVIVAHPELILRLHETGIQLFVVTYDVGSRVDVGVRRTIGNHDVAFLSTSYLAR